jgi:hypothetical protein
MDGTTVLKTDSLAYGVIPSYTPEKEGYIFQYWVPEFEAVTGDAAYCAQFLVDLSLDAQTWAKISEMSADGTASSYFAIGDRKAVSLSGKIGFLTMNKTYYAYIIGFDHNEELEGKGIHFGTFFNAETGGDSIALYESSNFSYNSDEHLKFFINHWRDNTYKAYNYGGWAGCDLRYDILGSTDNAPSGYGACVTTDRVGYDPSTTCATNPVAGTFMAALPSDLRAVMKPMTKYTNNKGGEEDTAEKVTATIDYLPLLAEYEIQGVRKNANSEEQNKQKQYEYYAVGNTYVKKRHTNTYHSVTWWTRSPKCDQKAWVVDSGSYFSDPNSSGALAPIFKV